MHITTCFFSETYDFLTSSNLCQRNTICRELSSFGNVYSLVLHVSFSLGPSRKGGGFLSLYRFRGLVPGKIQSGNSASVETLTFLDGPLHKRRGRPNFCFSKSQECHWQDWYISPLQSAAVNLLPHSQ